MTFMLNHPRILCLVCVVAMWSMALAGRWLRSVLGAPEEADKDGVTIIVSATLTLLGLIIGFTFSLATTRYDLRMMDEAEEANAIGTEYVRAELLPAPQDAAVKQLLRSYTDARVRFYELDYGPELKTLNDTTATLEGELWKAVRMPALAQPTPVMALAVSGMNDVLNRAGYTQSAWWNRVPQSAWGLMVVIALCANALIGYTARRSRADNLLLVVLPVIVSVSFFLIADIDSPRGGLIRVTPHSLVSLSRSLDSGK